MKDEISFQQPGTQSSNLLTCLGSMLLLQRVILENQHQYSINSQSKAAARCVGPGGFTTGSQCVSLCLFSVAQRQMGPQGLSADPTQPLWKSYGPHVSSLKFQAHVPLLCPTRAPPHSSFFLRKNHSHVLTVAFLEGR